VAGIRSGGGDDDQAAAPGLHGNGLGTVTLGGVALVPGGSATVPLTGDLAFEVQVSNQGENTETDVPVRVTVGDAPSAEETIDEIAAGETKTVSIPLDEQPPTGENVPVEVEVEPVPGEEMTDNNTGDFAVIFTS
jgi:CARDB protein